MGSLRVLTNAPYCSVQDLGRIGLAYYAIPRSGAMDSEALIAANEIIGLNKGQAAIEFNLLPPSLRFLTHTTICLTGADMGFALNGRPIERYKPVKIKPEDILKGHYAENGARAYLQVKGIIASAQHYNSASCYAPARLGHNDGHFLSSGDILRWTDLKTNTRTIHPPEYLKLESMIEFPVYPGPEYGLMTEKERAQIESQDFEITSQSTRMAALLAPALDKSGFRNLDASKAVLPGFIQLTPSGQLIVLLRDGQTTGGYPRVLFMKPGLLNRFNQLPFGRKFKLKVQQ